MAKTPIQERAELIKYLLESGELVKISNFSGYYYCSKCLFIGSLDGAVDEWLRHQFKSEKN